MGDTLLALVKTDVAAAAVLRQRCFSSDTCERSEALASEQAQEVLDLNGKNKCQDALRAEDNASDVKTGIAQTIRRVMESRQGSAPPAKKSKE